MTDDKPLTWRNIEKVPLVRWYDFIDKEDEPKIIDYTYKSLAAHVAMNTQYLLENDVKIFAELSLKAVNNEMELWKDPINQAEFYRELGKLDQRFK